MMLLLSAMGLLMVSGGLAFVLRHQPRLSTWVGAGGAVVGCLLCMVQAILGLRGEPTQLLTHGWGLPFGSFSLRLDALSAWFILPISGLSLLAAIYGISYMTPWHGRKSIGGSWFFYNVLISSMILVVLAKDGILFLFSWELMSLSSFFLVTMDHEKKNVRDAGWNYLVAMHIGTACLLALFMLLAKQSGSFDFDSWKLTGKMAPSFSGLLFLFAIIGFGTKAGFVPLHTWLPDAHPAAPSHVSAVMSGVMIKTGIYGLVRIFTLCDSPPAWWGWVLIGIGATSGILGVLFALVQHDLKRLLAYHSIENIGIITLGLGIGFLGLSIQSPVLVILGFSGGLLHVLNHALFKGLLFLGAGSLSHGAGTLDIEHLGGVLKRMPVTGTTFLIGAAAIAGLPPLNGFISEFLIYLGAIKGLVDLHGPILFFLFIAVASLTFIGGLAVACFSKAFGVMFLGSPRSGHGQNAHESGWLMRFPMIVLACSCVLVGLMAPWVFSSLQPVLEIIGGVSTRTIQLSIDQTSMTLAFIVWLGLGFLLLAGFLFVFRSWLLSGRPIGETVTWDCGYHKPSPRMQYTASSFVQPLASLFHLILHTKKKLLPPTGLFPRHAALNTSTPDVFVEIIFHPLYHGLRFGFSKLKWLQHGRVNAYILYIGLTLLILLIWNLR